MSKTPPATPTDKTARRSAILQAVDCPDASRIIDFSTPNVSASLSLDEDADATPDIRDFGFKTLFTLLKIRYRTHRHTVTPESLQSYFAEETFLDDGNGDTIVQQIAHDVAEAVRPVWVRVAISICLKKNDQRLWCNSKFLLHPENKSVSPVQEADVITARTELVDKNPEPPTPKWASLLPAAGDMYRHYRGGVYQVITVATDEASLRSMVVYRSQDNQSIWVRNLEEFTECVVVGPGILDTPRFRHIGWELPQPL